MKDDIKERLIALEKEDLEVLRGRVEHFNDKKKRKKFNDRHNAISIEVGSIIYDKELVGNDFSIDKDYYGIPEIASMLNDMAYLELEYYRLERKEEEDKCIEPKPEPFNDVVDRFAISGDIVITDPYYIKDMVRPKHSRSTIYGDWGCSVYEFDPTTEKMPKKGTKPFGEFCADAASVCITPLNEDERKKVEGWLKGREWCATIIEGFDGIVEYIERVEYYAYNEKWEEERSLIIRGEGTKNGKPFGFITSQTSL